MALKKLWFRAKRYGWGWYPATWQGWLCVIGFVWLMILGAVWFLPHNEDDQLELAYLAWAIFWSGLLIFVSYRTGEKPHWRWGHKK